MQMEYLCLFIIGLEDIVKVGVSGFLILVNGKLLALVEMQHGGNDR